MWFGRKPVGCPGTALQLTPPSVERNRLVSRVETPAYSTGVGWFAWPLAGSNTTNTMPIDCRRQLFSALADDAVAMTGKLSMCDQLTALSMLRHRPAVREPRKRM